MHEIRNKEGDVIARLWLPIEKIESSALDQIHNMAAHPRLHKWVSIMPDVHTGIGATIGAVLPVDGALIPAAVGVDIGCGICSVKTSLKAYQLKPVMSDLHDRIVRQIPLGFAHRGKRQLDPVHEFASPEIINWSEDYSSFSDRPIIPQLGTLGGGNHFIELQRDDDKNVWIMLHSGSRNIGNLLATDHIKVARKLTKKGGHDAPWALDYIEDDSAEGQKYIDDMTFAMEFARQNRFVMMAIIKAELSDLFEDIEFAPVINIHHNYASREKHYGRDVWVHRKGATRVTDSITGIIPGSMATPSYIVSGTNNEESFNSCSHGAGRRMSRTEAKKRLNIKDFQQMMDGVFSRSVNRNHIDEAPDAYKPIDEIINAQRDLIDVRTRLHPIMNIKG